MGNTAQGGMGGGGMSGAGGQNQFPQPTNPFMSGPQPTSGVGAPVTPYYGGGAPAPQGGGGNPFQAQQQQYMQYLSQALPSIQNGINAGTLQPGTAYQNLQTPQSFGLPGGGFGGMMPGGSIGGGGMPSAQGMK